MRNGRANRRRAASKAKGSVMIEMAVLAAIVAIGAIAATRNVGVEVRDLICQIYGGVSYANSPGNYEFNAGSWYWNQDGKPARCRQQIAW